jgi:hypothetical protein
MTILTEAGKDAVDALSGDVERIEEEVRERIEDAIRALDRYAPIPGATDVEEATMDEQSHGDYLDRSEVLKAVERGNW